MEVNIINVFFLFVISGSNDFHLNQTGIPYQIYPDENFVTDDFYINQDGIDFTQTCTQGTNYYHETSNYYYNSSNTQDKEVDPFNSRSMLGNFDMTNPASSNKLTCDPDVIKEVHELIEGINEDLLLDDDDFSEPDVEDEKVSRSNQSSPEKIEGKDCSDEFQKPEIKESPEWYKKLVCLQFPYHYSAFE